MEDLKEQGHDVEVAEKYRVVVPEYVKDYVSLNQFAA